MGNPGSKGPWQRYPCTLRTPLYAKRASIIDFVGVHSVTLFVKLAIYTCPCVASRAKANSYIQGYPAGAAPSNLPNAWGALPFGSLELTRGALPLRHSLQSRASAPTLSSTPPVSLFVPHSSRSLSSSLPSPISLFAPSLLYPTSHSPRRLPRPLSPCRHLSSFPLFLTIRWSSPSAPQFVRLPDM